MDKSALIYSVSLPFFHYTSQTRCLQCLSGGALSRVPEPVAFGLRSRRRSTGSSDGPLKNPAALLREARSGLRGLDEPSVLSAPVLSKRRPRDLHRTLKDFQRISAQAASLPLRQEVTGGGNITDCNQCLLIYMYISKDKDKE